MADLAPWPRSHRTIFREQAIAPCAHVVALLEAHEQQISNRIAELRVLESELRQPGRTTRT
ncbi:MAG: hypothetical protein ACRD0W_13615 [Acidimicrobiales bacterium]